MKADEITWLLKFCMVFMPLFFSYLLIPKIKCPKNVVKKSFVYNHEERKIMKRWKYKNSSQGTRSFLWKVGEEGGWGQYLKLNQNMIRISEIFLTEIFPISLNSVLSWHWKKTAKYAIVWWLFIFNHNHHKLVHYL